MCASRELVTYSTEQDHSLEANRFSAIQKSPAFYVNPKAHYRVHKSSPPVPILSQILPPNFLKIHLYIIPHLCLVFPGGFHHSRLPTQTPYATLRSPILATCHANLILLYFITRIILGEESTSLSSSLCSSRPCNNVEFCEQ